jgi:hypothetical protein
MATTRWLENGDDWTIERWRTERRIGGLEFSENVRETAPPLWKDVSVATAIALLLWGAAAVVFG